MINEWFSRKPIKSDEFEKLVRDISFSDSPSKIEEYVSNSNLFDWQKEILIKIAKNHDIGIEARKALASELISSEETKLIKSTNKTDILVRLGPILGLLGTLIPLGPGLAALGSGDITTLAESLTIAFDTTVTGLAVGGMGYLISKFKKQWYEADLIEVETLAEVELESLNKM
jgi:biopolymer transport protein ExbB/TolQ